MKSRFGRGFIWCLFHERSSAVHLKEVAMGPGPDIPGVLFVEQGVAGWIARAVCAGYSCHCCPSPSSIRYSCPPPCLCRLRRLLCRPRHLHHLRPRLPRRFGQTLRCLRASTRSPYRLLSLSWTVPVVRQRWETSPRFQTIPHPLQQRDPGRLFENRKRGS